MGAVMRRILILLAVLVWYLSVSVHAQPMTGEFRYPPVGTDVVTTGDTFRVESVNGFDAVLRNMRTGRTFGVHAQIFAGGTVGNVLQYDRAAVEALWPLSVGKTVSVDAHRENQVWNVEIKVVRVERITVPAGTFDTFVIEQRERGTGHNTYRGTTTRWYVPELGTPVKYELVVESQNNTIAWELKEIVHPAGYTPSREQPRVQAPTAAQPGSKPAAEHSTSSDPAKRLEQLQRLYDRKLISPEEYASKRKAILDSL